MTMRLKTTCAPNPRLEPLTDAAVQVEGIEFDWQLQPVPMLFRNNIANDDLELSEMSISETLLTIDRKELFGRGRWNWWAIPVFLSRGHFWGAIHVNANSGINELADLKGKRVGVPDYCMTAALWMKITLKDLLGIEASDIAWFNMRPRAESQMVALQLDEDGPPGVEIGWASDQADPVEMLERGELDAAIGLPAGRLAASSRVRKLMPDDGRSVIAEFFRRTGCFQVNHHFVLQRRLIDQRPRLPMELYEAFETSKQHALKRAGRHSPAYLFFEGDDPENQARVYGDDPYPLGLKAMSRTLERAILGSLEQGLIRRPIGLEAIYHASTSAT